jgi:predicted permease
MFLFMRVTNGFRALFGKRRAEAELDAELRAFLEAAVEQKVSAGMSREAALRAARVEIGSVEAVKDRVRDVGWESIVESVWQDVRFAFRMLRKQPGFTAATVATLALGIGGTTVIFSVVDGLFLHAPDGVAEPGAVRRIYIKRDAGQVQTDRGPGSWADYRAMRTSGPALAGIAAYLEPELVDVGRGIDVEQVRASVVSHDFLPVLGVRPALGRLFVEDDDGVPGAHPVAVISHELWRARFGGTADAVGKTVLVNGVLLEVVGVTQKSFTGIEAPSVDLWLPSSMAAPLRLTSDDADWRTVGGIFARYVARLAPGARDSAAAAQATTALRRAATDELDPTPEVLTAPLVLAAAWRAGSIGNLSLWLALVAGFVLIVACANVANLLLARAITRRRELAVRLSMGAGARRIARQHLTESVVLALLGGVAGIVVANWSMGLMRQFPLPPAAGRLDARLLLFVLTVSLVTAALFGVMPAIRAAQVDPVQALKDSRAVGGLKHNRTRRALVVLQIAVSLALLVGAGLFVRSLRQVSAIRSGIEIDRVLVARVDLNRAHYTPEAREEFYQSALARLSTHPRVERAAIVHNEPFSGATPVTFWAQPGETTMQQTGPIMHLVGPGYFEVVGTRLLRGRAFEAADRQGGEPVAVVNDAMARLIAADGNVVGLCVPFNRQVRRGGCTSIVGVVETQRHSYLDDEKTPRVFLARAQFPNAIPSYFRPPSLVVRTRTPSKDAAEVRAVLQGLRGDLPYVSVEPLEEAIREDLLRFRLGANLFSLFGVVALALSAVGLSGVLGYFVAERAHEIGIRRSLGASLGGVVTLVMRQGMMPVGVGILLGLAAAFAGTRYLASMLFGVEARDPVSFVSAAGFLAGVALLATLLPAWRAARIDPMVALRTE